MFKNYLFCFAFLLLVQNAFSQTEASQEQESLDLYVSQKIKENIDDIPYAKNILENSSDSSFSILTSRNLIFNNPESFSISALFSYKEDIKKMQKLASYISQEYKVSLINAEKIVLTAFNESKDNNLEPILLLSVIGVESTFKQYAKSSMGAIGLTQVVPFYHNKKIKDLEKEKLDIWSIEGNIKTGAKILKELIDGTDGNTQKALQLYNGSLSDKTKKYSKKVFNKMNILTLASNI